jgi:outer membrane protein assembly factor BamD
VIRRTVAPVVTACVFFCLSFVFANAQGTSRDVSVSHPDKILFVRAEKAIKKSNYAEARSLLVTLINAHPDSEYVPRAKLTIADSWYSEHAFKQAELEYSDFITFFPSRPEVAAAQRRIDAIHKLASF